MPTENERMYMGLGNQVREHRSLERRSFNSSEELLKKGIWLYFLLLIFEGALRKWVLPGLATPLLVVRDPIALWLVFSCWKKGFLPKDLLLVLMVVVGIAGVFTSLLAGHGNLFVAIFGARVYLLHYPMIFVIGQVFKREDVVKLGKATLLISIPIAILVALQFYSPQSAWVNRGVGGVEGEGFSGALGFARPPGPFSFTNGNTLFYSFVACYIFYFWLRNEGINRTVLVLATGALLIVIPLSISRGLLFSAAVTMIFTMIAAARDVKFLIRMALAVVVAVTAILVLSQLSFFQTAVEAFSARFTTANESEGGLEGVLLDRYLGGLIGAFSASSGVPFWGFGMGTFTNVGTMILSGKLISGISEGEWARTIAELGHLLGLTVILIRLGTSLKLTILSYKRSAAGDVLSWILLSFCLLNLPQGMWAQPTALGFSVVGAGLVLASSKKDTRRKVRNVRRMNAGESLNNSQK